MNRLLSLALVIGISSFGVAAAQAMPLAPLEQAQAGMTIPVAGGCGAGWHRGPGGVCRPNGYYGGVYFGAPVVVAPAPCGGRGTHRVCDAVRCWRVCN